MRLTQQLSITLPNELAAAVRAKVARGEYVTESEVIRDGLRILLSRDRTGESAGAGVDPAQRLGRRKRTRVAASGG